MKQVVIEWDVFWLENEDELQMALMPPPGELLMEYKGLERSKKRIRRF